MSDPKTPVDAIPNRPLFVGQLNIPDAAVVRAAFDGIFDRKFYTNHGPLVAEFETRLAAFLGVRHVICMTSGTVALMVAMKSAGFHGKIITPAYTFPATVQAMTYAGLEPVFCDVDPLSHNITVETVERAMTPDVTAIAGVHMWGKECDVAGLSEFAQTHDLKLFFDAAHAVGCATTNLRTGGNGAFEIFSFHATKVLNCAEGGCATTNDDALADAIRTARNFHEEQTFVDVPLRINAKMSEAQAAMGLISLDHIDGWIAANRHRYDRFRNRLSKVDGIRFVDHANGISSNYQYVVFEVCEDHPLTQDAMMSHLKDNGIVARRYFYPGMHKAVPYNVREWDLPRTDALCGRVIQVPSGDMVTDQDIDRICSLIEDEAARAELP